MPNNDTEMLKGILEGIVLAVIGERPSHGYDITASLRDRGFSDIAEGTVYALLVRIEQRGLVDVEKVPSEKGPPRKVFSLTTSGRSRLDEFWTAWAAMSDRLETLRTSASPIPAAVGSDVHAIVGDDPIVFAEEFKANYGVGSWLSREQQRLRDAVTAAGDAPPTP